MATRYVPAVPGAESTSRKVREQVQQAQRQLDSAQRKIKRDVETARTAKRRSTS